MPVRSRVKGNGGSRGVPREQSNRHFAANDGVFRAACARAQVEPTKRQASKWRRQEGAALEAYRVSR